METQNNNITYQDYIAAFNPNDEKNFPQWIQSDSLRDITEFFYNNLGLSDDLDLDLLRSLIQLVKNRKTLAFPIESYVKSVSIKSAGIPENKLREKIQNFLFQLYKKGFCLLEKQGAHVTHFVILKDSTQAIEKTISEHSNLIEKINERYIDILNSKPLDHSLPRPGELMENLPKDAAHELAAEHFTQENIQQTAQSQNTIIAVKFPNKSILLTTPQYITQLYPICLKKIKAYLHPSNPGNVYSVAFKNLNNILEKNQKPALTTDYFDTLIQSYGFKEPQSAQHLDWVRLTTILQSMTRNNRKYIELYQSGFLLSILLKDEMDTAKEKAKKEIENKKSNQGKEQDFAQVTEKGKTEIAPFSAQQIGNWMDHKNSVKLKEKYPQDKFNDFVRDYIEYITTNKEKQAIAHFVHEYDKYFIHHEHLVSYLSRQIGMLPGKFISDHRLSWSQDILNCDFSNEALFDDESYNDYLQEYVQSHSPLLLPLLSQNQDIFLAYQQANKTQKQKIRSWFWDDGLQEQKPLAKLLGIPRSYAYSDAMHQLSFLFWFTPIRNIRAWLLGIKQKSDKQTKKMKKDKPQKTISNQVTLQPEKNTNNKAASSKANESNTGDTTSQNKTASNEKNRKQAQKKAQEKMKQLKDKAQKVKDQITESGNAESLILKYENVWNLNLDKKAGTTTRKNVDDAIASYVTRTLHGKVPLDYEYIQKITKDLTKDHHFSNIHGNDPDKMNALAKYIELFMYLKYIKPKYKV